MKHINKYWDIYVNSVCLAYNSAINHTTGFSPLQLMIGNQPLIGFARKLGLQPNNPSNTSRPATIDEMRNKAKENISRSQCYNKKITDTHRQSASFKPNDLVLLEYKRLKQTYGGKLNARYIGPFIILKPDPKKISILL